MKVFIINKMEFTEQDFKNAVDVAFDAYDHQRMGALRFDQVSELINDTLKHMGSARFLSSEEVENFMKKVDLNSRGKLVKHEMFQVFKIILNLF